MTIGQELWNVAVALLGRDVVLAMEKARLYTPSRIATSLAVYMFQHPEDTYVRAKQEAIVRFALCLIDENRYNPGLVYNH